METRGLNSMQWTLGIDVYSAVRIYAVLLYLTKSFGEGSELRVSRQICSSVCFLKVQVLDPGNNGFLVIILLRCSLSLLTLKHRYYKFLNHCDRKEISWSFNPWAFKYILCWNESFIILRLQMLFAEGQAALFFSSWRNIFFFLWVRTRQLLRVSP